MFYKVLVFEIFLRLEILNINFILPRFYEGYFNFITKIQDFIEKLLDLFPFGYFFIHEYLYLFIVYGFRNKFPVITSN